MWPIGCSWCSQNSNSNTYVSLRVNRMETLFISALMKEKNEQEKKKDNQYKLNKALAIAIGLITTALQLFRLCRFHIATMIEMLQIYSQSDFLELMSITAKNTGNNNFLFPRNMDVFPWMSFRLLTIMQDSKVYCPMLSESAPVRKGISISALSLPVNNIIIIIN